MSEVLAEPIDIPPSQTPSVAYTFGESGNNEEGTSNNSPNTICCCVTKAKEEQCESCMCNQQEEPVVTASPSSTVVALPSSPEPAVLHPICPPPLPASSMQPRWNFASYDSVYVAALELFKACEPTTMDVPELHDVQRALLAQNNTIRGTFFGKNVGFLNLRNFPQVSLSKYNGPK